MSDFTNIEKIIQDAKDGKMYILVDSEDRENEGDLIIPGSLCGAEHINFMATHGRGLICLSITELRAKELKLPVIALSQLSRAVEQRDDHKPQLSDLRESGSIEQDADVVMFVYREAYYLERKEPRPATVEHAEWQAKMNEVSNLAELIIGKQRHGPTGNIMVEFEAMFTKFKDTQIN